MCRFKKVTKLQKLAVTQGNMSVTISDRRAKNYISGYLIFQDYSLVFILRNHTSLDCAYLDKE